MVENVTLPAGVLGTLSFMSEILGEYDTSSDGMVAWGGTSIFDDDESNCYFASLSWNGEAQYVEIWDGTVPRAGVKPGHNTVYTIFGYCRYHAIYHRLIGASLPIFREWDDGKTN
jgi:hypothetical protein